MNSSKKVDRNPENSISPSGYGRRYLTGAKPRHAQGFGNFPFKGKIITQPCCIPLIHTPCPNEYYLMRMKLDRYAFSQILIC